MLYFYFNECVGNGLNQSVLSNSLESLILSFNRFAKVYVKQEYQWIFHREPNSIYLSKIPLADIIASMHTKDVRTLFYAILKGCPIESYFKNYPVDDVLIANYIFAGQDATNLAIATYCSGILLSVPCSHFLCKDVIEVVAQNTSYHNLFIDNFYGSEENQRHIAESIRQQQYANAEGLDKIRQIVPNVCLSDVFLKEFNDIPITHQRWILDRFEEAKNGELLKPLTTNGTIIKPLNGTLVELRVVNPVDIRIYMMEYKEVLYIAKLALKSSYNGRNDQNIDIEKSMEIVSKMKREG